MKTILLIAISIILTYLFIRLYNEVFKDRIIEKAIDKKLSETKNGYFSKERIEKLLLSRGIDYLNPVTYILFKFIIMFMIFYMCLIELNLGVAVIGGIIGFFLLDGAIELSNIQDNKNIAPDIIRVYDSLKIQISAGVYITDALKESYLIAKNKRFKKALGELTSSIRLTADLEESMNTFNSKFNYKYIDIFCLTIKQGAETGQINKIIEDTAQSMKEIERIIEKEEENKVKLKSSMLMMMIYVGILAVVIYGLVSQLNADLMTTI